MVKLPDIRKLGLTGSIDKWGYDMGRTLPNPRHGTVGTWATLLISVPASTCTSGYERDRGCKLTIGVTHGGGVQ